MSFNFHYCKGQALIPIILCILRAFAMFTWIKLKLIQKLPELSQQRSVSEHEFTISLPSIMGVARMFFGGTLRKFSKRY